MNHLFSHLFANSLFFGFFISIAFYLLALKIRMITQLKILHPLLFSILLIIAFLKITEIPYQDYEKGANYISYFLTPATICLAVPLYHQLEQLKNHYKAIFIAVSSGVIASLSSILGLAWILGFNHQMYVTLLPKSITTAIGMGLSEELGGSVTLTVAAIVITGIIGSLCGEFICKIFKIKHPISVGLAIGTSSHAIGTSRALEIGEIEGAMSGLSITISGLITIIFASFFANIM